MKTAIIIGTGPSLTTEQIAIAKKAQADKKALLFGVNMAFEFGLNVHLACNREFYDHYGTDYPGYKWTWDEDCAREHKINHVFGKWAPGLSKDPRYIHYHHGSGPQIINVALHYGMTTMLLIGYDMRFPGKVNNRQYVDRRHYFGEYPPHLQHWPRTGPNGELEGLIKEMETIKPEDYGIRIINCTPGSAMTCFPFGELGDFFE